MQDPSTTGQPVENVGTPVDSSVHSETPNQGPTQTPADSGAVSEPEQDSTPLIQRATEAAQNLSPSEVPTAAEVPGILGALIYLSENGELPKPLHERFPDNYPDPDQ